MASRNYPEPTPCVTCGHLTIGSSDGLCRVCHKNYNRGWRTSAGPSHQGALERADMRGESNAWYEGYEDFACGWPKWSTPNAKKNNTTEGTK